MSGTAKIMALWPTGNNDFVGDIVQWGEGGSDKPTHIAVDLGICFLEATSIGIRKTDRHKYDNRRHILIEIEVPHPEFACILANLLEGRRYSYLSCLIGYLRTKGIKLPFNSPYDDCSEIGTIFLRGQGLEIFGWDNPAGITPDELTIELLHLGGQVIEKWPTN